MLRLREMHDEVAFRHFVTATLGWFEVQGGS